MNYQILLAYSKSRNLWVVEQTITNLQYGLFESRDEAMQMALRVSHALKQDLVIHDKESCQAASSYIQKDSVRFNSFPI